MSQKIKDLLVEMYPDGIPPSEFDRVLVLIRRLGDSRPVAPAPSPAKQTPAIAPQRGRPRRLPRPVPAPAGQPSRTAPAEPLRPRIEQLLAGHPGGLSANEISSRLESPLPTVYGVLRGVADRTDHGWVLRARAPTVEAASLNPPAVDGTSL